MKPSSSPPRRRLVTVATLLCCWVVGSCAGGPTPQPDLITDFSADPEQIVLGASSQLSWAIRGPATLRLDPGAIPVSHLSSLAVQPTQTTVYTLSAFATDGDAQDTAQATAQAMVVVVDPDPDPEPIPRNLVMRGLSLAGAEFGIGPAIDWPGEHGREYVYPHAAGGYDGPGYFADRGVRFVRLPFRWERLQRSLYGQLDGEELERLTQFLDAAGAEGLGVILDPHNYGRYCVDIVSGGAPYCADSQLIGRPAVPTGAFADFWRRLAAELRSHPAVAAYALMNEPVFEGEDAALWPLAAQAAVDAIREVDQQRLVIVPGNMWSSAHTWRLHNEDLLIDDPSDNLVYEAHLYFDANNEGRYEQSYDASGAYPEIGVDRLEPFLGWLEEHGLRGFIGEYGVPNEDARWLTVTELFLQELDEHCLAAAYWAGGPWWGDYPLSIEPVGDVDKPQMAVLQAHPTFECAVP